MDQLGNDEPDNVDPQNLQNMPIEDIPLPSDPCPGQDQVAGVSESSRIVNMPEITSSNVSTQGAHYGTYSHADSASYSSGTYPDTTSSTVSYALSSNDYLTASSVQIPCPVSDSSNAPVFEEDLPQMYMNTNECTSENSNQNILPSPAPDAFPGDNDPNIDHNVENIEFIQPEGISTSTDCVTEHVSSSQNFETANFGNNLQYSTAADSTSMLLDTNNAASSSLSVESNLQALVENTVNATTSSDAHNPATSSDAFETGTSTVENEVSSEILVENEVSSDILVENEVSSELNEVVMENEVGDEVHHNVILENEDIIVGVSNEVSSDNVVVGNEVSENISIMDSSADNTLNTSNDNMMDTNEVDVMEDNEASYDNNEQVLIHQNIVVSNASEVHQNIVVGNEEMIIGSAHDEVSSELQHEIDGSEVHNSSLEVHEHVTIGNDDISESNEVHQNIIVGNEDMVMGSENVEEQQNVEMEHEEEVLSNVESSNANSMFVVDDSNVASSYVDKSAVQRDAVSEAQEIVKAFEEDDDETDSQTGEEVAQESVEIPTSKPCQVVDNNGVILGEVVTTGNVSHVTCAEEIIIQGDNLNNADITQVYIVNDGMLVMEGSSTDNSQDSIQVMQVVENDELDKEGDDNIETLLEKFDDTQPPEKDVGKTAVPSHVLGRNIENPANDATTNGKFPPKPRLGVKIPNRNLTSQIVTKADIVKEVMKRNRLNQVAMEAGAPPKSNFFAKKLTHRLAQKIAPEDGEESPTTSQENSPVHTAKNPPKIQNNLDLLAILEGDGDEVLEVTEIPEKLKSLEKQIAMKQLKELAGNPRIRRRRELGSFTIANVTQVDTTNVKVEPVSPVHSNGKLEGSPSKRVTRSNPEGEPAASTNLLEKAKITQEKSKLTKETPSPVEKDTSAQSQKKGEAADDVPKFSQKLAIKTYSRKRKQTDEELEDEEEEEVEEPPAAPVVKKVVQIKTESGEPVYITKSSRVIKKKVIWDPDEVQPKPLRVSPAKPVEIKVTPKVKAEPKSKATPIAKEPKISAKVIEIKKEPVSPSKMPKKAVKPAGTLPEKVTRSSVEKQPAVEKVTRSSAEKQPVVEKVTRSSAEKQPVAEKVTRSSTEKQPVVEKVTRSSAEKQPVVEKVTRSSAEKQPVAEKATRSTTVEKTEVAKTSEEKMTPPNKIIKKKHRSEIDKLLQDEGAIKMLYDIKNSDENQNTSTNNPDLKNMSNEVKNNLQNNSVSKISPKSLRRKEVQVSPMKSPAEKPAVVQTPATISRQKSKDSNRSSVHTPPASPTMIYTEASCIIRRHSNSSYSSEDDEVKPEGSERVLRRKNTAPADMPKAKRVKKEVTVTTNEHKKSDDSDKKFTKMTEGEIKGYKSISVKCEGHLAHIIVAGNKTQHVYYSNEVLKEMVQAINIFNDDDNCHVILLTSSGSSFCNGLYYKGLVSKVEADRTKLAKELTQDLEEFLKTLARVNKILVVGLHGNIEGLGVTMLPLFDMAIASDTATFATPYARLGCAPEAGCLLTVPGVMCNTIVSELLLASNKMDASEARRCGLVTRVIPSEKFQDSVISASQVVAQRPSQFLLAAKQIKQSHLLSVVANALPIESGTLAQHWVSPECQKAFSQQ